MAVREVAFKYAAKGADAVRRKDRQVQSQVNQTAKEARQSTGDINRWMEANKGALLAIGAAASGALAGILTQSPTLRAELASVRIAMTLFADTIINDVLPSGRTLTDTIFDLNDAYANLPDALREPTSALLAFGSAALLAARFINPVVGFVTLLIGVFVGLNNVIPRSGALMGVVAVAAGVLLVAVGAIPAAIMLVVGSLVVLTGWLVRNRDEIAEWIASVRDAFMNWLGRAVARALVHIFRLRDRVTSALGSLRDSAFAWGSDVIDRFVSGIRSGLGRIRSALARVRDIIMDRISFDIAANDRMAEQWGRDLTEFFAQGVDRGSPNVADSLTGMLQPSGGGGGGQSVSIGEINVEVMGGGSGRRTGKNIADEVSKQINDQFESRR